MAQENAYLLRLEPEVMKKIRYLAGKDKRSINMQLCVAVEYYVEQYEKEHGEIPLPEKE